MHLPYSSRLVPKPSLEELAYGRLDRLKQTYVDSGAAHTCYISRLHPLPAYLVGKGDAGPETVQNPVVSSRRSVLNTSPG